MATVMCSTVAPQLLRAFPRPRITSRNVTPSRVRVDVRAKADAGVPTLYGAPGSRTQIVEWLALELGVNVKSVTLNRAVMSSPEYRTVHPFGKIPGMKAADGETGIFESGALMLYVADLAGSLPTAEARGAAASWVIWANATMWPALEMTRGKCDMDSLFGPVDEILGERDYLLGDELSVADVAVASYIKYGMLFFRMKIPNSMPNLGRYMMDVESRPHFQATVGGG